MTMTIKGIYDQLNTTFYGINDQINDWNGTYDLNTGMVSMTLIIYNNSDYDYIKYL